MSKLDDLKAEASQGSVPSARHVSQLVDLVRGLHGVHEEARAANWRPLGELRDLMIWAGIYDPQRDTFDPGSPEVPPGFCCVRCEGDCIYCVDCGSRRCVCPAELKGTLMVCHHDRGALKPRGGKRG